MSVEEPRRLAANISALTAGQLITWSMSLVWTLIVPRALGPVGVGVLVTAWAATGVLSVVLGMGTRNYLVREIVVRPADAPSLLGTAIVLRVGLAPLFVAAAALFANLGHFGSEQKLVLYLATGATLLTLVSEPMLAVFQAVTQMRYLAYSDVVNKSAQGLLGVALALIGWGAVGLTAGWLVVSAVVVVLDLWWVRAYVRMDLRTDLSRLRSMFRESLAYWAFGVFFMIYLWIDSVLLSLMAPAKVVGWYGVPTKLFSTMMFVPVILSTAWLPRLVKAFERGPDRLKEAARSPVELVAVLSVPVCAYTAIAAGPLIPALYGESFRPAVPVMVILALCIPAMYVNIMLNQVLVAAKRQMTWTWVMAGATVVNPLLNLVLIRVCEDRLGNGAIGAAISLTVTEVLITSVGVLIVGTKVLNSASLWRFARAGTAGVVMWLVSFALQPTGNAAMLAGAAVTFVVLAWLLRLASSDDLAVLFAALRRVSGLAGALRRRSPTEAGAPAPGVGVAAAESGPPAQQYRDPPPDTGVPATSL